MIMEPIDGTHTNDHKSNKKHLQMFHVDALQEDNSIRRLVSKVKVQYLLIIKVSI